MKKWHFTLIASILGFALFVMEFHNNSTEIFPSFKSVIYYFVGLSTLSIISYILLRLKVLKFGKYRIIWSHGTRITFWVIVTTLSLVGLYPIPLIVKGDFNNHEKNTKVDGKTNTDIYNAMIGSGQVGISINAFDTDLMKENGFPFTYSQRSMIVNIFNMDSIVERNIRVSLSVDSNLIKVVDINDPNTADQRVNLNSLQEEVLLKNGYVNMYTSPIKQNLCTMSGSIDYESRAINYRVFYSVNCVITECGLYPVTSYIQAKYSKDGKFIIVGEGIGESLECQTIETPPPPSLPSLYKYEYALQPIKGLKFIWN